MKRFYIFYRRYILACLILILPFLLEAILSRLIPASSNVVNTETSRVKSLGSYSLGMANYRTPQVMTYFLNDSGFYGNTGYVQSLLNSLYTPASQITLNPLSNNSINNYILDLRRASLDNMLYRYYAGKDLSYDT